MISSLCFPYTPGMHRRIPTNVLYLGMADDILAPLLLEPDLDNLFVISLFDAAYSPDYTLPGQQNDIRDVLQRGHNGQSHHLEVMRKYGKEKVTHVKGPSVIESDIIAGHTWNMVFYYDSKNRLMEYQYRNFIGIWDDHMTDISAVIIFGATTPIFEPSLYKMLRERCIPGAKFYDIWEWGNHEKICLGNTRETVYVHDLTEILDAGEYPPNHQELTYYSRVQTL